MWRPDGDPARATTVAPGGYEFATDSGFNGPRPADRGPADKYRVVWWDPHALALAAGASFGLRRDDLIAKDGDGGGAAQRLADYRQWESARSASIAEGRAPSITSRTVTQMAAERDLPLIDLADVRIDVVDVPRVAGRPFGPLFGTLVHSTLATVPLEADESIIRRVAATQGRILLGSGEGVADEVYAVAEAVLAVLRHPLFDEVRAANLAGLCHRELPLIWQAPDGALVEGTVDLAFEERGKTESERRLVVLDFKTDRDRELETERYRRQLAIYCQALRELGGGEVRGVLMRV
jgi:ATP-dependent exoDNAse (exonuclease V) beta subunit